EMIIGTINDPTFGPIIMTGLGGIATELFRDVVYRPAPVSEAEAAAMVAELKSAALLDGFRGAVKADKDALTKLIARISLLAAELKDSVS
ncbi:acetate--CoA ligase family protein, partial [Acinetobacter baumannii]